MFKVGDVVEHAPTGTRLQVLSVDAQVMYESKHVLYMVRTPTFSRQLLYDYELRAILPIDNKQEE